MIYLDHNAGAPLRPAVAAWLSERLRGDLTGGNPSSTHGAGRAVRRHVESARREIARVVGADPLGVTFTSGGTEANNLAVFGAHGARGSRGAPTGLLVSPLEHPSIRRVARRLAEDGAVVVDLPVDAHGRIRSGTVAQALVDHPEVGIVCLSAVNHELGNRYDVAALAAEARSVRPDAHLHVDAVQALGKLPVQLGEWEVDTLAISAHKVGGPAGVGALVHRPAVRITPRLAGGEQERGRRVGTENVLGICGFARAVAEAEAERTTSMPRLADLTMRVRDGVVALGGRVHGDPDAQVGNTVNFGFPGCEGELVCMALDLEGIAVSTGAACSAGSTAVSDVLLGLGLPPTRAKEAVRVSLGSTNSGSEIDRLLALLPGVVDRIRSAEDRP